MTRTQARLDHYQRAADPVMAFAALALLVLISIAASTATGDLPTPWVGLGAVLWVVLVIDVITRVVLAPDRWAFARRHPLDILSVLVPFLRILLIGRLFAILGRGRGRLADRATGYVGYLTALCIVFGGLLVVEFERGAPGATIDTFSDGVWWAIVTVATVGYGDYVPVTSGGKAVGVVLIVVSVGLLSIITANISSRFVLARAAAGSLSQAPIDAPGADPLVLERLDRIEAALNAMARDERRG